MPAPTDRLLTLFLTLGIAIMACYILVVGKALILPVAAAVIAVYVLTACVRSLSGIPVLGIFPAWFLHLVILALFTLTFFALGSIVAVTLEEMVDRAPEYQANLERLAAMIARTFGADSDPDWDDIRRVTIGQISLPSLIGGLFNSLTSLGASLFIFVVYAGFLMGEWRSFPRKLQLALADSDRARRTIEIAGEINGKIGQYLGVKTAINVVLGLLSFAVLALFGVDFAPFWALTIAVLNYIPYVGSYVGVHSRCCYRSHSSETSGQRSSSPSRSRPPKSSSGTTSNPAGSAASSTSHPSW